MIDAPKKKRKGYVSGPTEMENAWQKLDLRVRLNEARKTCGEPPVYLPDSKLGAAVSEWETRARLVPHD